VYKHWSRKENTNKEKSLRRADYEQREDNTEMKADDIIVGTDLNIITKIAKNISQPRIGLLPRSPLRMLANLSRAAL